jgi:carboxymethylenebutenolidase
MSDSLAAQTVMTTGQDGDQIETYVAGPSHDGKRGGVVVIHGLPGYDRACKEIVRRFAELGYDAAMPNLYTREGLDPAAATASVRAKRGVPDHQLVGDVAGAADYLRSLPTSNGRVGVIGYCAGGRQAVLSACRLPFDAAVDCYGGFVTRTAPDDFRLNASSLVDQLPSLGAPLLGLFGNEDEHPSPEEVDELDAILTAAGKQHEFHRYQGAGHAFFTVDRTAYRVEAANDGWKQIERFLGLHLGALEP